MKKSKERFTNFFQSAKLNNIDYMLYFNRLKEIAISMYDWENLPDGIDSRFLELTLFEDGQSVFFYDEVLENYLALQTMIGGNLNVYRLPIKRTAFSVNGYRKDLTIKNSVIIYNNMIRTNSYSEIMYYAIRLWNLDRIIDVNANAQKTPILIQCDENQRLTLKNLYQQYDGNAPVIYGTKKIDMNKFDVLKTDAPYIADKIHELKVQIWNEALTYLGVPNVSYQKKERLVSDEVNRELGGTIASRESKLKARKQACEQINKMFNLEIKVGYSNELENLIEKEGEKENE